MASLAGASGVYGAPKRDMVGYGSATPDPRWPGGVSRSTVAKGALKWTRIIMKLCVFFCSATLD